jgi:hypothetical protein
VCEIPTWDAQMGSGGRAAAAVSALSPGSVLHTYSPPRVGCGAAALRALGIDVRAHPSSVGVAFAYFHPLSRPYIEPPPEKIPSKQPIYVSGDTVLRFGFLEGEAIVAAGRAIYDPQNSKVSAPFGANGSRASELALVLNERELRTMVRVSDIGAAAAELIRSQGASVVVVKRGPLGATVFQPSESATHIPAYRSERVFKIGSGDIFSAIFAVQWGEAKLTASHAADLASRSVSAYCATCRLPISAATTQNLNPVGGELAGPVLLMGAVTTLGRRYTMEEARFCLGELGVAVVSPALDRTIVQADGSLAAVLVLSEGMPEDDVDRAISEHAAHRPIVVLAEGLSMSHQRAPRPNTSLTDDFTSALYMTVWAAAAAPVASCK